MKQALRSLGLLLIVLLAQHGAVVHELGHAQLRHVSARAVDESRVSEASCGLCTAYAQTVTPAFCHALHLPLLALLNPPLGLARHHAAIDAAVPRPRSRGPPTLG